MERRIHLRSQYIYRAKHAEPTIKLTWYFYTVSSFAGEWLVAVSNVVSLSLSQKGPFKDILWLEDVNIQRGPRPLSKHAIFWHMDFGELTYTRICGRHYIYFHLWGFRLLEENTRGPSLKQEAPRLWYKTSHHLNHSQRKDIFKKILSPCQGYCHLCKQAVKIVLTYHGPKNPDHRIPKFRVKNTQPDKLRLCHLWMKLKN